MKGLSDQTLEEYKKEIFETVRRHDMSFEEALEYVFKQAHLRGSWAGSIGSLEFKRL